MSYGFRVSRFLAPALIVVVVGSAVACTLVIGDIPEATSSTGGTAGTSGTGAESGSGGFAGSAGGGGTAGASGAGGTAGQGATGGVAGGGGVSGAGGTNQGGTSGSGASGGTGGTCLNDCDCDGDFQKAVGPCGGQDCDDWNADVFKGQTKYFDKPANVTIGFDYDCSGQAELKDTATVNCALLCGGPGKQGWTQSPPACGATGPWGYCPTGAVCSAQVTDPNKTQLCH